MRTVAAATAAPRRPPGSRSVAAGLLPVYLAAAGSLTVLYYLYPERHVETWTPLGLLAVVAMVAGIRRFRPSRPAGWYLLTAATLCFIAGDTAYTVVDQYYPGADPYTYADPLYLLTYPLFSAGLVLLIRGRGGGADRASLLDALILTTGVGLLVWVYLVVPFYQVPGISTVDRAISVAYPLGDVLVLGILARLVTAGGLRLRSTQLLVVGAVGLLASDVIYGLAQLKSNWNMGGWADLGWIVFYTAWGAAALHSSMRDVTDQAAAAEGKVRTGRFYVVAAVGLIAPVVLLVDAIRNDGANAVSVGVFSACLYVLVLVRLAGIVTVHKQAVARERALRVSSESLVTAQDLSEISSAAFAGVATLAVDTTTVSAALYLVDSPRGTPVASSSAEPAWDDVHLWTLLTTGGGLSADGHLSVSPLRYNQQVRGMLVVRSSAALPLDVHASLSTLASQVALALESNRLASDLRLRQNDAHFERLIKNASDVILVVGADASFSYGAQALAGALGLATPPSPMELLDLVHPADQAAALSAMEDMASRAEDDAVTNDWRLMHTDGGYRSFEVVARNLLADPAVAGVVFTMRDVTHRRALEEQLTYQAFHDGLTNLPNRAFFQDRAAEALLRRRASGTQLAMVMLDLDDFKEVNDSFGHAVGDAVLSAAARRVTGAMRSGDIAARLGGDEFAILLEDVPDLATAAAVAERVLAVFTAPFVVNDRLLYVHSSAGLVVVGGTDWDIDGDADLTELLLRADLALYAAKEGGKRKVQQYESTLRTVRLDRVTRRAELKAAVDNNEFFLQYQPIVEIETGEVVGAEALVRWRHPRRGVVGPNEFITLAEETGLIVPLGRWVLDTACAQAAAWGRTSLRGLRMSVNVSGRQIQESEFVEETGDTLARHGITPGRLVLELTETVLFHQGGDVPQRLAELKKLGVKIAIDDFGTGYSSLGYLQHFSIDILKVDKSFVDGLGTGDADAGALAHAMVSLSQLLRLEVVAEGIERSEQRDELWSMGCRLGQGYFYATPLDPTELTELLCGSAQLGGPSVVANEGPLARLRPPARVHRVPSA